MVWGMKTPIWGLGPTQGTLVMFMEIPTILNKQATRVWWAMVTSGKPIRAIATFGSTRRRRLNRETPSIFSAEHKRRAIKPEPPQRRASLKLPAGQPTPMTHPPDLRAGVQGILHFSFVAI